MDPRTGEVLALANWPRVDANDAGRRARATRTQNRAVGYTYEPGSTFKAFTVAGALQDGTVTPEHAVRPAAADPGRRPRRSASRTRAAP